MRSITPKSAVLAPVIHTGDERRCLFGVWEGLLLESTAQVRAKLDE